MTLGTFEEVPNSLDLVVGARGQRRAEPTRRLRRMRGRCASEAEADQAVAPLFHGHTLGEISRLVHVAAFSHRHVVGQKLHGNGEQDGRQQV